MTILYATIIGILFFSLVYIALYLDNQLKIEKQKTKTIKSKYDLLVYALNEPEGE